MPLQELRAPPPVTGLADLGGILLDTSRTYAAQKRQDQLLAQKRGQELQDVREQRSYQDARDETNRQNRLLDTETELKLRAKMAVVASLRNEGLLAPGEENDEAKVATAYEEFKNRGLEKLYDEMMHTPGPDGQPLLNPADVTDPDKVQAAKAAYGQLKAHILQGDITAKENTRVGGQAAADRALVSDRELDAKVNALEAKMNTPSPQPTEGEIMQRARQKWLENNPGSKVAPTEISKLSRELPDARTELQTARFMAEKERNDVIRQQVIVLKTQQMSQAQETSGLGRAGFFANPALAAPPPPSGMGVSGGYQPMQTAAPSAAMDFTARLKGAPAAVANTIDNPTNNPVIARGNAAVLGQLPAQIQSTQNNLLQDIQEIDRRLGQAALPTRGFPAVAPSGPGQLVMSAYDDPVGSGKATADLLKQKAMKEAQLRQLAMLQGGPAITPPAVNTATTSTPAFSFGGAPSMAPATTDWWKTHAR